jgi:hypothetical protein
MMQPTQYRQGEYGPIADTQATAANAFNAGQKHTQDQNEAAQKLSDDMQAKKISNAKNNVDAMHGMASMQQAQFAAEKEGAEAEALQTKNWKDITDSNQSGILASINEHDKNLNQGETKALLTSGMTTDELMASPFKDKMLSQNMIQDGIRQVYDPATQKSHTVPTWSVLDPNATIKLNQDMVDRVSKINPQFKGMFQSTAGNVRLSVSQAVAVNHQMTSVAHAEDLLQSVADSKDPELMKLGIKGDITSKLATAVQGNPSAMRSVMEFENGGAHGGDTSQQLNRILQSDGGDAIFKALGTNRDAVQNYVRSVDRKNLAADALAKQGGLGEKAPAAQDQVDKLIASVQPSADLTGDDSRALMADVPTPDKDGKVNMTQGQAEKLTMRRDQTVTSNKNNSEKKALANGDPVQMQKTASNIIEGDVNDLTKIASMRGNARANAINAIHDEAAARGLDTTRYSEASMATKAKTLDDYSGNKRGSTGSQIASFNAFTGHLAAAVDNVDKLKDKPFGLTRSPIWNTAMDKVGKQVTDDPDWKAFNTSLLPVQHEISNFLAGGYKADAESDSLMHEVLDPHETPNRISSALRQLADTADIRLQAIGQRYLDTMGTTKPDLLSDDSRNTFKRLGMNSKADAVSQPLPRGWKDGQPQNINLVTAQAYMKAAGGNKAKAIEIAKDNGWTF